MKIGTLINYSFGITIVLALFSCQGNTSSSMKDTTIHTSVKENSKSKQKTILQQLKDDGVPSTDEILADQRESYKDTIKVDTSYIVNSHDTVKVKLRHYCTYDNKINLPQRYLAIYDLKEFRTHDFESALELTVNSKTVFKGKIQKKDFNTVIDDELRKYGILTSPVVESTSNGVSVRYSISVPLSDVGKSATLKIDFTGNKHLTAN